MNTSEERFNFHLNKLSEILKAASASDDPALYILKNNARTPAFMLEALCRVYREQHNEKLFTKLNKRFKQLEDSIGVYDFYYDLKGKFENTAGSDSLALHLEKKTTESRDELLLLLEEDKWIYKSSGRTGKIREQLAEAGWKSDKKFIKGLEEYYLKSIEDIKNFVAGLNGQFTLMEDHVHELRRKLRWLSIYPHALLGGIQMNDAGDGNYEEYITENELRSPFNTFPEQGNNTDVLILHRPAFLALSFMISELGKLKDEGLKLETEMKAGMEGENESKLDLLLEKATLLYSRFNEMKVLDNLVAGISKQ